MKYLCYLGMAAAWTISKGGAAIAGGDIGDRVSFSSIREAGAVELGPKRSLDVGFQVVEAPPAPQQAMVKVGDQLFNAKFRGKNAKVVVPHSSLSGGDGTFPVEVIVGSSDGKPLREFAFEVKVVGSSKSVSATRPLQILPEIYHQFKTKPRTVNPLVALLFCGIIDLGFAALFYSWNSEVGFKVPPASVIPFLVCVTLVESVFVGYFINWSVFRTLGVLGFILPFLLVTGHAALLSLKPAEVETPPIKSLAEKSHEIPKKNQESSKSHSDTPTSAPKHKSSKR